VSTYFTSTNKVARSRYARHFGRDLAWRVRAALRRVRPATAERWREKLRALDAAQDACEEASEHYWDTRERRHDSEEAWEIHQEADAQCKTTTIAHSVAWNALPQPIRRAIEGGALWLNDL
jgi:hypothetical protein